VFGSSVSRVKRKKTRGFGATELIIEVNGLV
jgi:hypothetical protein